MTSSSPGVSNANVVAPYPPFATPEIALLVGQLQSSAALVALVQAALGIGAMSSASDVQVFSGSGTWTPANANPKSVRCILVGGGGGGGGGTTTISGTANSGGGGGG